MEGLEATTDNCQVNLRRRLLPVVEPQDFQSCSGAEIQVGAVLSVFRTYAVHQSSELYRSSELSLSPQISCVSLKTAPDQAHLDKYLSLSLRVKIKDFCYFDLNLQFQPGESQLKCKSPNFCFQGFEGGWGYP